MKFTLPVRTSSTRLVGQGAMRRTTAKCQAPMEDHLWGDTVRLSCWDTLPSCARSWRTAPWGLGSHIISLIDCCLQALCLLGCLLVAFFEQTLMARGPCFVLVGLWFAAFYPLCPSAFISPALFDSLHWGHTCRVTPAVCQLPWGSTLTDTRRCCLLP